MFPNAGLFAGLLLGRMRGQMSRIASSHQVVVSSCEGKNKEALARITHGVEGACIATKPAEGLLTHASIDTFELLVNVLLHQRRRTLALFGMPLRVEAVHSLGLDPLQIFASFGCIVEPACPIIDAAVDHWQ